MSLLCILNADVEDGHSSRVLGYIDETVCGAIERKMKKQPLVFIEPSVFLPWGGSLRITPSQSRLFHDWISRQLDEKAFGKSALVGLLNLAAILGRSRVENINLLLQWD